MPHSAPPRESAPRQMSTTNGSGRSVGPMVRPTHTVYPASSSPLPASSPRCTGIGIIGTNPSS